MFKYKSPSGNFAEASGDAQAPSSPFGPGARRTGIVNAAKDLGAVAATLGPAAALALVRFSDHHEFVQQILRHDPNAMTSLALIMMGGSVATLTLQHRHRSSRMEETLGQMLSGHRRLEHLIRGQTADQQRLEQENQSLSQEIDVLRANLNSGGREEEDDDGLWTPAPATRMASMRPYWNREVEVLKTPQGPVFRATDRVRRSLLRRVVEGTALKEWRIVLSRPVEGPFSDQVWLPARKLLFLERELRDLARSEGLECVIDKVVRLSLVAPGPSDMESFFCFTNQTGETREPAVLRYYRHPASNNAGDNHAVLRHRGHSDYERYWDRASDAFFGGLQVTFDQLRDIVESGIWPQTPSGDVIHDDHKRYG